MELLEVASILQLEDHQFFDKVNSVLVEEAKQAHTFQELFYSWNTAVTDVLEEVLEVVLRGLRSSVTCPG